MARDAKGRAWCGACWAALAAASPRRVKAGGAANAPEAKSPAGIARPEPRAGAREPEVLDLLEDDFAGKSRAPCPKCGGAMRPGVPACGGCGFDPSTIPLEPSKAREILGDFDPDATPAHKRAPKKAKATAKVPSPVCSSCGYALANIPASAQGDIVCPECGTRNHVSLRREVDEELSAEVARWAVLRPALMIAGGVGVSAAVLLAMGWIQGGVAASLHGVMKPPGQRGWGVALGNLAGGMAFYAWASLIAWGTTAALGLLWTGIANSLRMMLLNVAGLVAVAFGMYLALGLIPLPIPWWAMGVLCWIVYVWYLADMQDLDLQEAGVVAGASVVAVWLATMGVILMF
jgi:DNA-directed RNA polymerase subunit RPC12/RpoP